MQEPNRTTLCTIHLMPRIARSMPPVIGITSPSGNNRATVFFDDEDRQIYLKQSGRIWQSLWRNIGGPHQGPHSNCTRSAVIREFVVSAVEQGACRDSVCREDDETDSFIRKATSSGRPFGSEPFIDMLEFRLNQLLKPGKPGRPRKQKGECAQFI